MDNQKKTLSLVALILGIASVALAVFNAVIGIIPFISYLTFVTGPFPFFLAIAGIVLAIIGLKKDGKNKLAILGLILSVLGIAIPIVAGFLQIILSVIISLISFLLAALMESY